MKRYWTPLLMIVASGIVYKLLEGFVPSNLTWILTFLWLTICVMFGYFMSGHSKKNNRWLGKVILSIVIVLIYGYRLDVIAATEFRSMLNVVGLNGQFLDLILIYCGWAFFLV